MNKRLLSALLALCMMITLFPAAAFAAVDNAGGVFIFHPLPPSRALRKKTVTPCKSKYRTVPNSLQLPSRSIPAAALMRSC